MAYYDHYKWQQEQERTELAKKFINSLPLKDGHEVDLSSLHAKEYVKKLEAKIKEQTQELEKYQNFFRSLQDLLPPTLSTRDIIG